ncbi:MAG: SCO family protein [Chthoniobacteraceae bacterium]
MKTVFVLCCALLTLGYASCSRAPQTPAAQTAKERAFEVRGILRAINFAAQTATVEHEAIPDYMPSMTMPFDVKTMAEVEPLKAGDAIAFRLVVTDRTSWIEGVKKIAPSEVRLPSAASSASVAPANVERLKVGDRLPDFTLVDEHGQPITRATFAGQPLILTFIFTRCPLPNFCPLITNNFREIRAAIAGDPALAKDVQMLSVSFDSEFDTPEVLARYAQQHAPDRVNWRFATGTPAQIEALTAAFSVHVQPEAGTISHGLCTALIGPDGVIREMLRGNAWKPAELVAALHELQRPLADPMR